MGRRDEDLLIERCRNAQAGRRSVVLCPEGQTAYGEVLLTRTGRDAERGEVDACHVRDRETVKLLAELTLHALVGEDDAAPDKALKRLA